MTFNNMSEKEENRKRDEMGRKDNNDALAMLGALVGTRNETIDDVVQSMLDYAEAMRKRYRKAVKGDKSLPCNVVALRMKDMASRVKTALKRERARRHAKVTT